jgi:MYXO-CTERM domain-containing protein
LSRSYFGQQAHRVEAGFQRRHAIAHRGRGPRVGQQALARCRRRVMALPHLLSQNFPKQGPGVNLAVMDDFVYGEPVSAVPEADTLMLLAGALLGFGLLRRRKNA